MIVEVKLLDELDDDVDSATIDACRPTPSKRTTMLDICIDRACWAERDEKYTTARMLPGESEIATT